MHLAARSVLLPSEDARHFDALLQSLIAEFEPQSDVELLCLEEMAVAKWKMRRLWNLESTAVQLELDARAAAGSSPLENPDPSANLCFAWNGVEKQLSGFALHDIRAQRQYTRALNHLQAIRAWRKGKPKKRNPKNEPKESPARPEAA